MRLLPQDPFELCGLIALCLAVTAISQAMFAAVTRVLVG